MRDSFTFCQSTFRKKVAVRFTKLFHDGDHYHIETSLLICRANQRTGFYMRGTSVMKELKIVPFIKIRDDNEHGCHIFRSQQVLGY